MNMKRLCLPLILTLAGFAARIAAAIRSARQAPDQENVMTLVPGFAIPPCAVRPYGVHLGADRTLRRGLFRRLQTVKKNRNTAQGAWQ